MVSSIPARFGGVETIGAHDCSECVEDSRLNLVSWVSVRAYSVFADLTWFNNRSCARISAQVAVIVFDSEHWSG